MVEVITVCPFCHKEHSVFVPEDGYFEWMCGERIQDVMPNVSADDREMLMSGICPSCWNGMFGEDSDE